jgi:hypothetical protein
LPKIRPDSSYNLVIELVNVAIGVNSSDTTSDSRGVITKRDNLFPNSCFGYTRFTYSPTTTIAQTPSPIFINMDMTKNKNMSILPPYSKSTSAIVNFKLHPDESMIILGIQNRKYASTLFYVKNHSSKVDESD